MLLVPDSKYRDKVLIQLGTIFIDKALQVITKKDLSKTSNWWRKAHFSLVISRQVNAKEDPNEVLLDLKEI